MWTNRKSTLQIYIHPPSFGLVRTNRFFSSVLACFGSEYWLCIFLSDCIGTWLWIFCIYTRSVLSGFWWSWLVCIFIHWQHFCLPYTQSSGLLQSSFWREFFQPCKRLPLMILYSLASDTVCELLLYEKVTKGLGEVNHSASLQWAKFAVQNCSMFQ